MEYEPIGWEDGVTPVDAENLNKMDAGIQASLKNCKVLPDGTNLDDIDTNSIYLMTTSNTYVNVPDDLKNGWVVTFVYSDARVQTVYGKANGSGLYTRRYISGGWTVWHRFATESELIAARDGLSVFYSAVNVGFSETAAFQSFSILPSDVADNGREVQAGDLIVFKSGAVGVVSGNDGVHISGSLYASLKGTDGSNGFSPEITIERALVGYEKTVTITIKSEKDGEVVEETFSISDGADGKSAYAYAQDGGYTGTESEFADKLAKDNDVFYVTVTEVTTESGATTLTGDKTVEEIAEAYGNGRSVACQYVVDGNIIVFSLIGISLEYAIFSGMTGQEIALIMYTNDEIMLEASEFATADSIPTSLPNPYSLKFTGAATGDYNGSAYMTVHIPKVDKTSVTNALGYTPADETDVDQIKEQVQITPGQVTEQARDIMGETDHGWTASTYVNYTTGATSTHDSYIGSVNYIEIPEGGRLFVTYATEYLTYPTVAFYDSDHNYISGEYPKLSSTSDREEYGGQYGHFYTIPENAKYFRVSYQSTLEYHTDILLIADTVVGTQVRIPNLALAKTPISGKTVVCFGDSLIGMYRGEDSATAVVADETGATVYNVGFGGCRMAVHPTSGYGAFSMWALAKAISENDWTTQDAQASSGSAYFPEQLALLKSIDFANVDIVVIHYGTNDFTAGNGVEIDNVDDPDDYNSLCGALRYSVEKLLAVYPKLRIYISLPCFRYWIADDGSVTYPDSYTNSSGHTLTEFVEALRGVAAEYNLPVIDSYYGLGINRVNAISFLQSDGTHHNADGRERFGRFIGASLVSQQTSGKSGMDTAAVNALIENAIGAAIGGAY